MRPGLTLLKQWAPYRLTEAADIVSDIAYAISDRAAQIEDSAASTRRRWVSDGADQAFNAIGNAQAELETLVSELGRLEDALANAAAAIGDPRDCALENESRAKGEGFIVADDGAVTPSMAQLQEASTAASLGPVSAQLSVVALEARAAELSEQIQAELDAIERADAELSAAISGALALPAQIAIARVPIPFAGGSPGLGAISSESGEVPQGTPNVTALNWKQITANLVVGTMDNTLNNLAGRELAHTSDEVLAAVTGNRHLTDSAGPKWAKRVPLIGSAITLLSAQASVNSDIEEGISPAEAYVSNYAGAGAGVAAGALAGAMLGSFVPVAGTAAGAAGGGFVVAVGSALVGEAAGQLTSKFVQLKWK